MMKIIARAEGHYEIHEAPFSRTYEWYPTYATVECDCGGKSSLTGASVVSICRCGVDHSAVVQDIQKREGQLQPEVIYPLRYDLQEQAEQHLRDETLYSKNAAWLYNDVTSDDTK